jgi:hypothetical protein
MLKRYGVTQDYELLKESKNGELVKYEDYLKEKKELESLISKLKYENEELKYKALYNLLPSQLTKKVETSLKKDITNG